jgi:KUP system potassium uptake protein
MGEDIWSGHLPAGMPVVFFHVSAFIRNVAMKAKLFSFGDIIKSLGLVFGDIGTSPIYTLTVVFILVKPTPDNTMGVLSLIAWTLVILVTVEYAWLAMSLSKKGEGGTIVLREILAPKLKSVRQIGFVTFLTFIGISLLIGDGVITPAISILSAVEGLLLIPGLAATKQDILIVIAGMIAMILFMFQKKGTEKVSVAFGPVMVIWFLILAFTGIISIVQYPEIISALNPYYAVSFLVENGIAGFFILSEVILCATGGEALYADMGHLGRRPITYAWYFVFVALLLNYLGQGAFAILHPGARNMLFEMVFSQMQFLYVPFLILSILATVIASQAMISGMFSIVYQGIRTHVMPLFKVEYTSEKIRSQIYIGAINWFLLLSVLFVMNHFRESSNLAAAYGLAVTGTMTLTGIMMTWIFAIKKRRFLMTASVLVAIVDMVFFAANCTKIPNGGYWSIIIAAIPFFTIILYTRGQKRLYQTLKPMEKKEFLNRFNWAYRHMSRIRGSALFFSRGIDKVPPYIVNTMFLNNIIYEDNIVVSIILKDDPYGVDGDFKDTPADGLRIFEIRAGYLEVFDVDQMLRDAGIDEKAIFYGVEDIATKSIIWKLFAIIKKLNPTFVQFYRLPHQKLHGVVTRVEM